MVHANFNGEYGDYREYGERVIHGMTRDLRIVMILSSRVMGPVSAPLAAAEPSGEAGSESSERSESSENRGRHAACCRRKADFIQDSSCS